MEFYKRTKNGHFAKGLVIGFCPKIDIFAKGLVHRFCPKIELFLIGVFHRNYIREDGF